MKRFPFFVFLSPLLQYTEKTKKRRRRRGGLEQITIIKTEENFLGLLSLKQMKRGRGRKGENSDAYQVFDFMCVRERKTYLRGAFEEKRRGRGGEERRVGFRGFESEGERDERKRA